MPYSFCIYVCMCIHSITSMCLPGLANACLQLGLQIKIVRIELKRTQFYRADNLLN